MNLDLDPSWLMWTAAILKVVRVLTDAFSPSEVAKTAPLSELVLMCWGHFEVENFHSEFVVALVVTVKSVSTVEMCFFAICGKSDWSHFCITIRQERKCLWGVFNN